VALVTGAARGIGLAVAARLREGGAEVLLNDLDEEQLAAAAMSLGQGGPRVRASVGDITDDGYARELISEAGALGVLVNNAALAIPGLARDLAVEDWRRTLNVNLTAPFVLAVEAAETMRRHGKGGRIINVASIAGKRMSVHAGAAYTASKAGLLGLTKHLAFEYAGDGITINAVCPGGVLSPGLGELLGARGNEKRLAQIPIGRFLEPREIANAVAFLASPDAGAITGIALDVDGGSLLGWEPAEEHRRWNATRGSSSPTEVME
jgi:NAD(P)-dependent dehydrogenase (short-subunit alcohol dehydrogenase family)